MSSYNTTRQSSNPEPPTLEDGSLNLLKVFAPGFKPAHNPVRLKPAAALSQICKIESSIGNPNPPVLEDGTLNLVGLYNPELAKQISQAAPDAKPRRPSLKATCRLNGLFRALAISMDPEGGAKLAEAYEADLVRQYVWQRRQQNRAHARRAWILTAQRRAPLRPQRAARTRRPAGVHVQRSRRTARRARAAPSSDPDSSTDPPLVASSLRRGAEPLWFDARSAYFCATAAELRRTVAWSRTPVIHPPRTTRERAPPEQQPEAHAPTLKRDLIRSPGWYDRAA
jgi:hypothetical protein